MRNWIITAGLGASLALSGYAEEHFVSGQADEYRVAENDRRDPFTYIRAIPKIEETPIDNGGRPVVDEPKGLTAAEIEQRRVKAQESYDAAEAALLDNTPEALKACENGLSAFEGVQVSRYRELDNLRSELLRLRKAALNIKSRNDAQHDLGLLGVHVAGIVCRPRQSEAIINGKILQVGDTLEINDNRVLLTDIRPQLVIVQYRGYKFEYEVTR